MLKKIQQKNLKMKNSILFILVTIVLLFVMIIINAQSSYASWVEDEDGIHYKDKDNNYVTGFQTIEDDTYYFDEDGNLLKGKIYVSDEAAYYFADEDGKIMFGVIDDENHFFITDDRGKIKTGFVEYKGNRYFFDMAAEMVTGWFKNEENWYYADASGKVMTGFIEVDGYRYYLDENGIRVSDAVMEIDGVTYVFNKDGSVDENATALYPLLVYVNDMRKGLGLHELSIDAKVQSCAIQRAADLVNGYGVSQEKSITTMLNNRGVSSSGGYELAYGGLEGYNLNSLFVDIGRDERFGEVLRNPDVTDVGFGMYENEGCFYYDLIFIMK